MVPLGNKKVDNNSIQFQTYRNPGRIPIFSVESNNKLDFLLPNTHAPFRKDSTFDLISSGFKGSKNTSANCK